MSNTQSIHHKVGATFSYSGLKLLPAGTWSAKCESRDDNGVLLQAFDVTLTPPVSPETRHAVTVRAESTDTLAWVPDIFMKCDIAFYDAGTPPTVVPTDTFSIKPVKRRTHVG